MESVIRDRLSTYIAHELVGEPDLTLGEDDDLLLSGLVDSLGVVRLLAFIEEHLGVAVPPGDVTLEHFSTLAAMTRYLAGRPAVDPTASSTVLR